MGFLDGLGGKRRRRNDPDFGDTDDDAKYLEALQAEAQAARIRLLGQDPDEDSSVPPTGGAADGVFDDVAPALQAMPDEKPDPAAQWDDVRGCWIKWDVEANQWVDVE